MSTPHQAPPWYVRGNWETPAHGDRTCICRALPHLHDRLAQHLHVALAGGGAQAQAARVAAELRPHLDRLEQGLLVQEVAGGPGGGYGMEGRLIAGPEGTAEECVCVGGRG